MLFLLKKDEKTPTYQKVFYKNYQSLEYKVVKLEFGNWLWLTQNNGPVWEFAFTKKSASRQTEEYITRLK